MTPWWLPGVLVACSALPGAREAILGELVVGDEEACRTEALMWAAMLTGPQGAHWVGVLA